MQARCRTHQASLAMGPCPPVHQRRASTGTAPLSARCLPPLSQRQRPAGFAAPARIRGALPLALFVVLATLIMLALAGEVLWNDAWQSPFLTFASLQVVFFVSHLTLLDRPKRGAATRLALLAPSLYLLADLVFNASYTFASPMRDLAIGVVGWHLTAKALDIGIVYGLEGKGGPRWCVPDWEKEAIEHGIDGAGKVANGKGGHAPSPFWKRTPLPRRPRWAVESNHLPSHWKLLPLPIRAIDCCIWALDVMFLRRPGTSLLFSSEMRALEWSKKRLETSGRARRETQERTSTTSRLVNPSVTPFGYTETPLVDVCLELILVVWAVRYISGLDITPRPGGVSALPILQQLLISLSIGVVITFPADAPEAILIPLSQRWPLQLPCTAVIPYFRGVARSKSLTDLWGTRWHAFSKRDFVRLSLLIPIAPRLRALNVLKAFFWSAAFHCKSAVKASRSATKGR